MPDFSKPQLYTAKVAEKKQLTKTVYMARYELVDPRLISFVAGQTFMIKIAPGVNRSMSIASPPQDQNALTSIQDVSPGGPGSKWMESLKVGDMLQFMAPLGRFVVNQESPRKRVLVATGSGIAPFRSMMFDASDGLTSDKEVSFYWGLRHKEDIYLQNEIHELQKDFSNLKYYLVLSRPPEGWTGLAGHTTDHVLSIEKDLINSDFYLCGNKNMIKETCDELEKRGVPRTQMHFDPYY